MNPVSASVVPVRFFVVAILAIAIMLQLVGGIAFPPLSFRLAEPRKYWTIIAVYGVALAVVAILILWR